MKTRIFNLVFVGFVVAVAACQGNSKTGVEKDGVESAENGVSVDLDLLAPNESLIKFGEGTEIDKPECGSKVCFEVKSTKDLSFIAVDVGECPDLEAKLSLYAFDEEGKPYEVNITPKPHGNGKSCPNIPADALKFDGLSEQRYLVCVTASGTESVGTVKLYAKAGQTCAESKGYDGKCKPCENGAGGSGGYGGSGEAGKGGSGGYGGSGEAGKGGSGGYGGSGEAGKGGSGGYGGSGEGGSGGCGGEAPCEPGLTRCGGECVDLDCDPSNCGACGNVCGEGEVCQYGKCVCL